MLTISSTTYGSWNLEVFGSAHAILVFSALSSNKRSPEPMLLVYTMYVDKYSDLYPIGKLRPKSDNQDSDICKA